MADTGPDCTVKAYHRKMRVSQRAMPDPTVFHSVDLRGRGVKGKLCMHQSDSSENSDEKAVEHFDSRRFCFVQMRAELWEGSVLLYVATRSRLARRVTSSPGLIYSHDCTCSGT